MPSPIVTATLQAAFLSALSNILAQGLTAYNSNKLSAFTLDPTPLLHFVLFALLSCPPNFLWQQYLEETFPGYTTPSPSTSSRTCSEKRPASSTTTPPPTLNKTNTAIKFALDQTLGATVNTLAFIAGMGALLGKGSERIVEDCRRDFFPLLTSGLKLWPMVSLANFTVVPVERRLLVGNLVGLCWGVYLSLVAAAGR